MSNNRGISLTIDGHPVVYATEPNAPVSANRSVKIALMEITRGVVSSVDLDTMQADTGGTSVRLTDVSESLTHFITTPLARVAQTIPRTGSANIVVDSTNGFPSAGFIWVGRECFEYTSTTATEFQGITRAALTTESQTHLVDDVVYGFPNSLLGRRAILTWYDPTSSFPAGTQQTQYVGTIDSCDFNDGAYTLSMTSNKKYFEDANALSPDQGRGKVHVITRPESTSINFNFETTPEGNFLENYQNAPNWDSFYIRINNELIRFGKSAIDFSVTLTIAQSVVNNFEFIAQDAYVVEQFLSPGNPIEFLDGFDNVVASGVVTSLPGGLNVRHNANIGLVPAFPGGPVLTPGLSRVRLTNGVRILGPERGALFTTPETHEAGSEVLEYRVLEGNQVDILLWAMLSRDGDKTNGPYDILPPGWGAAIDQGLIDYESFENIARPRAGWRRYALQQEINIIEMIGMVALSTNCRFYWDPNDGLLKARAVHDTFPLSTAGGNVLDDTNLVQGDIPELRIDISSVKNFWEWGTDYDLDGEQRGALKVAIEESRRIYGDRPMPKMEDQGFRSALASPSAFGLIRAFLSQRSVPTSVLTANIEYDEDNKLLPGDLVSVTLPHIPNMRGSEGIVQELFEVTSYTPEEDNMTAQIVLVKRDSPERLGHIGPAARVLSLPGGNQVEVELGSVSLLSNQFNPFTPPGGANSGDPDNGKDDIDWFLFGDTISLFDVTPATELDGVLTTSNQSVVGVDYANNILTLDSIPGWLAPGDLIKFSTYNNMVLGPTGQFRDGIFIFYANEASGLVGTDPAFRWGM